MFWLVLVTQRQGTDGRLPVLRLRCVSNLSTLAETTCPELSWVPIKVDSLNTWSGRGCDGFAANPQLWLVWFVAEPHPPQGILVSPPLKQLRLLERKGVSPWGVEFVVWDWGTRSGLARLGLNPLGGT